MQGMAGLDCPFGFVDSLLRSCLESLQCFPPFEGCSKLFMDQLAAGMEPRFLEPGQIVAQEGEVATEIMFLRRGVAEIQCGGKKVEEYRDGATIGNPSMLVKRCQWPHSIVTGDFCDLHVLPVKAFRAAANMHPSQGTRVARAVLASQQARPSSVQAIRQTAHAVCFTHRLSRASTPSTPSRPANRFASTSAGRATAVDDGALARRPNGAASPRPLTGTWSPGLPAPSGREACPQQNANERAKATLVLKAAVKKQFMQFKVAMPDADSYLGLPQLGHEPASSRAKDRRKALFGDAGESEQISTWAYAVQEDDEARHRDLAFWMDSLPLFSNMDGLCLESLLPLVQKKCYRRGTHIATEGTAVTAIHMIYAGDVEVTQRGDSLQHLGPKCVVGEGAIVELDDEPPLYDASFVAYSSVVVTFAILRTSLAELFRKDPKVYHALHEPLLSPRNMQNDASLTHVEALRGVDPGLAKQLQTHFKARQFAKGAVIIAEGAPSADGVLLCDGWVRISNSRSRATTRCVKKIQEALIFDVANLLCLQTHSDYTVRAITECDVRVISAESLRKALEERPAESWIFRRLAEDPYDNVEPALVDFVAAGGLDGEMHLLEQCWQDGAAAGTDSASGPGPARSGVSSQNTADSTASKRSSPTHPQVRRTAVGSGEDTPASKHALAINPPVCVPHDLRSVSDFSGCSSAFLHKLETRVRGRLYIPQQHLLRQGEDMGDVYILERGSCCSEAFGSEFEPLQAPCLIGGAMSLLTRTVFTTVVARETCFVATICKDMLAAALDEHPKDRRILFARANLGSRQYFDEFAESAPTEESVVRSLALFPALDGAPARFLWAVAKSIEMRVLLPGQTISLREDAKLYIIFDGCCQLAQNGDILGEIGNKMLFGELGIFGFTDETDGDMVVRTVELCTIGTLTREQLFAAFQTFPEERLRFERLVQRRLEETVSKWVARQPCFNGVPYQLISKICCVLDRRLYLEETEVVREGEVGNSMIIVNRGKLQLVYAGLRVGMLWPGKAFGASQMLGMEQRYHATVLAQQSCHLLFLSRESLSTLVIAGCERPWISLMRQRAQASFESELKLFRRKLRECRSLGRLCVNVGDSVPCDKAMMQMMLTSWRLAAYNLRYQAERLGRYPSTPSPRAATPQSPRLPPKAATPEPQGRSPCSPPMRFSRGLQRIELDITDGDIAASGAAGHHGSRHAGRLDLWRSKKPDKWLAAVRDEIPNHIMALKVEARGESPMLVGLVNR